MHVHWLQQQSDCGQIMQKVVLHSNSATNNNSNFQSSTAKINEQIAKPTLNSLATNSQLAAACSTFPLTKLRLKSSIQAPIKETKKRKELTMPQDEEEETSNQKRMKFLSNLKAKMTQSPENMLMEFNQEIQIKDEPIDEDDLMNTTPPSLMPEVIIKEEPADDFVTAHDSASMEMKSLLINNNKRMNPDFNGKIIPLMSQTPNLVSPLKLLTTNNNNITMNYTNFNQLNTSLKNITNLKLVRLIPASIASSNRLTNLQFKTATPGNDVKLMPATKLMPAAPLQYVKLVPNTQFLTFKSNDTKEANKQESLMLKLQGLKPKSTMTNNNNNNVALSPETTVDNVKDTNTSTTPTQNTCSPPPPGPKPLVAVQLNSMLENTTIDSDDFKKLQSEAFRKAEELRKKYISKKSLIAIDNLPEKKQLIASLKQQIAQVETPGDSSLVNSDDPAKTAATTPNALFKRSAEGFTLNTKKLNEPPTLYLPILSVLDVELVEARYQHPDYTYKWLCPYCGKIYEIKRCLKSHLTRAHNLTNRDMEKINAQAKPFLNTGKLEQKKKTQEKRHLYIATVTLKCCT